MMYATDEKFLRDFVSRTKVNYMDCRDEYKFTQLINSAIGLLFIPKETVYEKITNDMIDRNLLTELRKNISVKDKPHNNISFKKIVRHTRNGIAHWNIQFEAEQPPLHTDFCQIKKMIVEDYEDYNPNGKDTQKADFRIVFTEELLYDFLFAFSDAAVLLTEE